MKIAVVGGGITGSVVASELAKGFAAGLATSTSGSEDDNSGLDRRRRCWEVVVFDQGRRGPGGRASHRSVAKKQTTAAKDDDDDEEEEDEFEVLPDDEIDASAFQFDHGCQFFRADSSSTKDLVRTWVRKGWAAPWKARFGSLPASPEDRGSSTAGTCASESTTTPTPPPADFFGLLASSSCEEPVYSGVGGMHLLPRRILEDAASSGAAGTVVVHRGTRVSNVAQRTTEPGRCVWDLSTTVGIAAFHDTKESDAAAELALATRKNNNDDVNTDTDTNDGTTAVPHQQKEQEPPSLPAAAATTTTATTRIVVHEGFDAVILTDISSSFGAWHRASAGLPSSFVERLPPKLRVPLFSCMIALQEDSSSSSSRQQPQPSLRDRLPFDAFVVNRNPSGAREPASPLWYAARSGSKPGFPDSPSTTTTTTECWTLVSTPSYAVDELRATTMRDPVTGAFRAQENEYLNKVPGPALRDAFYDVIGPYLPRKDNNDGDDDDDEAAATLPNPPTTVYLQAQRWGSGLPLDPSVVDRDHTEEICGTAYASRVPGSSLDRTLPLPSSSSSSSPPPPQKKNFVADDDRGLYYAGDFCSHLNPGFEAAALSGLDLAHHILHRTGSRLRSPS